MSIEYDEFVGMSSVTWDQVYEAFKTRIVEELGEGYGLVELHTWESGPDLELCTGCGMHAKSHLDGCPVAADEIAGVLTTEVVGFCAVCGQELMTAHDHACPGLGGL